MRARATGFVFLGVLLASVGCDHASKQLAISTLTGRGDVSLAGDALQLRLASNPGAFLSLGAGLPEGVRRLVFLGMPPVLASLLCIFLLRAGGGSLRQAVGLGLVAGGGLANWLDRLLHDGAVTDFLILGLGPLHTGIFNLADVAVVVGVVLLLLVRSGELPTRRPAA